MKGLIKWPLLAVVAWLVLMFLPLPFPGRYVVTPGSAAGDSVRMDTWTGKSWMLVSGQWLTITGDRWPW
jgi:hypothetical protein